MSAFPWKNEVILPLEPVWGTVLSHRGQTVGGYKIEGVPNEYGFEGELITVAFDHPAKGPTLLEFRFVPNSYRLEDLFELKIGTGNPGADEEWALGLGWTIQQIPPLGQDLRVKQAWRRGELCHVYATLGECWADWSPGRSRITERGCKVFRETPTALSRLREIFGEPLQQRINFDSKTDELLGWADILAFAFAMQKLSDP